MSHDRDIGEPYRSCLRSSVIVFGSSVGCVVKLRERLARGGQFFICKEGIGEL